MHKAPTNKGMGRLDTRLPNIGNIINNNMHMLKKGKHMFAESLPSLESNQTSLSRK